MAWGDDAVMQSRNSTGWLAKSVYNPSGWLGVEGAPDMATPGAVDYDWSAADAAAGQSNALGNLLMQQAQGQGPSAANAMLAQANAANAAQQSAQAQSASGGAMNRMLAQQAAAQQAGTQAQQTAGQMAAMRQQEMINARKQAADLYAQQQQFAQQRQLGMGEQSVAQRGQNVDVGKANLANQQKTNAGMLGAAGGVLGAIFSDERTKKDIQPAGESALSKLFAAQRPVTFEYKEGGPEHVGVLAQDLEKTPLGAAMVSEGPNGMKMINPTALGTLLAEVGALEKRLAELEDKKGKKGGK